MAKVIIVGGGIFGTMHSYFALKAGHEVINLEKDAQAQSASVRNFGLIWVSGRLAGAELDLASRARELWSEVGANADIGFRPNGSLTIAKNSDEWAVMSKAIDLPDAVQRGFSLLTPEEVRQVEPLIQGEIAGALRCSEDAAVEPSMLFVGMRNYLLSQPGYSWHPFSEVADFEENSTGVSVTTTHGITFNGEKLIFTTGAFHTGLLNEFLKDEPLRRVRLQMGATVSVAEKLTHSIADADSLRYYPGFIELALNELPSQSDIAQRYKMQLLLAPRLDGTWTIGDTHEYEEPFGHELHEDPYRHLCNVIEGIFGFMPSIERRWDGVYSQITSSEIYLNKTISSNISIVTGGGGRGNTLSPAIAELTIGAIK